MISDFENNIIRAAASLRADARHCGAWGPRRPSLPGRTAHGRERRPDRRDPARALVSGRPETAPRDPAGGSLNRRGRNRGDPILFASPPKRCRSFVVRVRISNPCKIPTDASGFLSLSPGLARPTGVVPKGPGLNLHRSPPGSGGAPRWATPAHPWVVTRV